MFSEFCSSNNSASDFDKSSWLSAGAALCLVQPPNVLYLNTFSTKNLIITTPATSLNVVFVSVINASKKLNC